MNKFFLILTIFAFLFTKTSLAQKIETTDESLDEIYKEYRSKIEEYGRAHQEYLLKRSEYLRFKTLSAKESAINQTRDMLKARDEVVIYYIKYLRQNLKETESIDKATKERLLLLLEQEIEWFSQHRDFLNSVFSLEDLVRDSDKAKERFNSGEVLFYEVIVNIPNAKVSVFLDKTEETFNDVKQKTNEIREDTREGYSFSSKKFQILDKWLSESENLILRAEEAKFQVSSKVQSFSSLKDKKIRNTYDEITSDLRKIQFYLKDAASFLNEVIREIKTAEN